jgi:hypothetical protein
MINAISLFPITVSIGQFYRSNDEYEKKNECMRDEGITLLCAKLHVTCNI